MTIASLELSLRARSAMNKNRRKWNEKNGLGSSKGRDLCFRARRRCESFGELDMEFFKMIFPRIRGRVGEAVANGTGESIGWMWEISVSINLGDGQVEHFESGLFKTKIEADEALSGAVKLICEKFEEQLTGQKSGKYLDLKTNEIRAWDKSDLN